MKIQKVYRSPRFEKAFSRLSIILKNQFYDKEDIFRNNCFDSRLRTHRLQGQLVDYWSFSVNYYCRVLFKFLAKAEVLFVNIGSHSIYK